MFTPLSNKEKKGRLSLKQRQMEKIYKILFLEIKVPLLTQNSLGLLTQDKNEWIQLPQKRIRIWLKN